MTKVLLDTDIGTNSDDHLALAYLLAQPECDLLGITPVTGGAVQRAMLASAICRAADRDVPIFPGAEQPLQIPQQQNDVPLAFALPNWPHRQEFPRGQAVDFMRRTIRENPGEVSLLCIGPLTNIAQLFDADPEIPDLLGGLLMMCGGFEPQQDDPAHPDTNARIDPQAAARVYAARARLHRSIGTYVCRQASMELPEFRKRARGQLIGHALAFVELWARTHPGVPLGFADPLIAVAHFDRSLCMFERGTVTVDHHGHSHFDPGGPDAPHEIARAVDEGRFFERYFAVFE